MSGRDIKVASSKAPTGDMRSAGEFDCYLALPQDEGKSPAVVMAASAFGVDNDLREIADEFAAHGYIAAAPDLFWRSIPGPLARDDDRAKQRTQPRLEKIREGEADMADTLAEVRKLPQFNGRAAAMGFCYGGPYAIVGPKRLGYDAGISCHGTQLFDFVKELEGVTQPICIIWGDHDTAAPLEVREAYRRVHLRMKNVEVHIFRGIEHGYMMRGNSKAFSQETRDFSMGRALAILAGLRGENPAEGLRKAS